VSDKKQEQKQKQNKKQTGAALKVLTIPWCKFSNVKRHDKGSETWKVKIERHLGENIFQHKQLCNSVHDKVESE